MWSTRLGLALLPAIVVAAPSAPLWRFDVKQQRSGIVALESIVVSDSLVIFFDNATNDQPLKINGHGAWGALWNLENDTVQALDVKTNSFCASGALLSNGTMVSLGGTAVDNITAGFVDPGGEQGLRIFEPCASPSGEGCTLFEDPKNLQLLAARWYPSSVRIYDGSLMIIGGTHTNEVFYNTHWENSYEFFPRKEDSVRKSAFLDRTLPVNLFPRGFALPDGKVFIVANNQSIIYDVEKDTEKALPEIPNGVRVTNPMDGSAILLPLSPPDYVPEVLICGGSATDDTIPVDQLSSQKPASSQCSRIKLTEEGIAAGWQVEQMLEPRIMPELLHLPNGQLLIINGGRTGFPGIGSVKDPVGNSNADNAVLTPSIYTPDAPSGKRISNVGMPTSGIARLYHSTATLTSAGNFLIAGSNPNGGFHQDPSLKFPSEDRVETLDPPYMFVDRPTLGNLPDHLQYASNVTVPVTIPSSLSAKTVQVALLDLGFSSHAFHSSARHVFMEALLSADDTSLTFTTPPSGRVYPPGPGVVFLTINDVTSPGIRVMVGSGKAPPTSE